jgi:hypothetical protein
MKAQGIVTKPAVMATIVYQWTIKTCMNKMLAYFRTVKWNLSAKAHNELNASIKAHKRTDSSHFKVIFVFQVTQWIPSTGFGQLSHAVIWFTFCEMWTYESPVIHLNCFNCTKEIRRNIFIPLNKIENSVKLSCTVDTATNQTAAGNLRHICFAY